MDNLWYPVLGIPTGFFLTERDEAVSKLKKTLGVSVVDLGEVYFFAALKLAYAVPMSLSKLTMTNVMCILKDGEERHHLIIGEPLITLTGAVSIQMSCSDLCAGFQSLCEWEKARFGRPTTTLSIEQSWLISSLGTLTGDIEALNMCMEQEEMAFNDAPPCHFFFPGPTLLFANAPHSADGETLSAFFTEHLKCRVVSCFTMPEPAGAGVLILPLAEDLEALLGNLPPFQGRQLFLMPLGHLRAFPPSLFVSGAPKEAILTCPALRTERRVADFEAEGLGLVIMYDSAETVESIEQDMFFSPEEFTDGQHTLAVDFYRGTPERMMVAQDVETVQDPDPEPEPEPEPEKTYSSLALDTRDVFLIDRDSLLFMTRTEFPLYRTDSNTRPTLIGVMAHTLGCIQAEEYVTAKGPERLMPSRMRNYQYSMADIDEYGMLAHFPEGHLEGSVRVQQQDCLVVVSKLSNKHPGECIACLNMANETRVGGGYNTGARAQEEELMRRTTLSFALDKRTAQFSSTLRTDYPEYPWVSDVVFTTDVELFRKSTVNQYDFMSRPVKFGVVSTAAVQNPATINLGGTDYLSCEEDSTLLTRRIHILFRACIKHGVQHLVLSALGCGAFRNPVCHVAWVFRNVLPLYRQHFKSITFAIMGDNFDPFKNVILRAGLKKFTEPLDSRFDLKYKCNNPKCHLRGNLAHESCLFHVQKCPNGVKCPLIGSDTREGSAHNALFTHPIVRPCNKGGECKDFSEDHCDLFTHPPDCKYGGMCNELADPVHCKKFRHHEQHCLYGPMCTKVLDHAHFESHGHGIVAAKPGDEHSLVDPDKSGLHICPYASNCQHFQKFLQGDDSAEVHKHMAKHVHQFWPECRHGEGCTSKNSAHYDEFAHPGCRKSRFPCRYGLGCRDISDPAHLCKYAHPVRDVPYASFTANERVFKLSFTENVKRVLELQKSSSFVSKVHPKTLVTIFELISQLRPTHRCNAEIFASVLDHGYFMSRLNMTRLAHASDDLTALAVTNPELLAIIDSSSTDNREDLLQLARRAIKYEHAVTFNLEHERARARTQRDMSRDQVSKRTSQEIDKFAKRLAQASKVLYDSTLPAESHALSPVVTPTLATPVSARPGIGYEVDKTMGTDDTVFSILGPNSFHRYGEVYIVFKSSLLAHPHTWAHMLAATFWNTQGPTQFKRWGHGHLNMPKAGADRVDYYYDHIMHLSLVETRRALAFELACAVLKRGVDLSGELSRDKLLAKILPLMVSNTTELNSHHMIECHLPSRVSIDHIAAIYLSKSTFRKLPGAGKQTIDRLNKMSSHNLLHIHDSDGADTTEMYEGSISPKPCKSKLSLNLHPSDDEVRLPMTWRPGHTQALRVTAVGAAPLRLRLVSHGQTAIIDLVSEGHTEVRVGTSVLGMSQLSSTIDCGAEREYHVSWTKGTRELKVYRLGSSLVHYTPIECKLDDITGHFSNVVIENRAKSDGLTVSVRFDCASKPPEAQAIPQALLDRLMELRKPVDPWRRSKTPTRRKSIQGTAQRVELPICRHPHLCEERGDPYHCANYRHVCVFGSGCPKQHEEKHSRQFIHVHLEKCVYGVACRRLKDIEHRLTHSHGSSIETIPTRPCKYGVKCDRSTCTYLHAKPDDDPGMSIHEGEKMRDAGTKQSSVSRPTPVRSRNTFLKSASKFFSSKDSTTKRSSYSSKAGASDERPREVKPGASERDKHSSGVKAALASLDLTRTGFGKGDRDQQVVFILDATGSMGGLIRTTGDNIVKIATELSKKYQEMAYDVGYKYDVSVRFAVVAYRDIGDSPMVEAMDFTDDLGRLTSFTRELSASGGGDYPENICAGIDRALTLSWQEKGVRTAMIWGDAPNHWISTARLRGDSHPEKDEFGQPWSTRFNNILAKSAEMKVGYRFFDLRPDRDTFKEMKDLFAGKLGATSAVIASVGGGTESYLDAAVSGAEESYAATLDKM
ncbi:Conserved hypothetical protein CHP02452 [Carpediemonas membranifera]|uniref:Microbial-type PARG catalytic domain-containing protein n=1 Tax=Carpediemonas membranifera TaxID=201153 RepID=A0A8J6AX79_9EUKA|nr:Conserved hypothetical protein CHP02452 [Carpediemonas membranifera]|eukprot:KAG9389524.1 Conserved hypothetical protein CHP02452 [Carpediemonas membranifera]